MEESAARGGADSVEHKICDVFLKRWSEMQSDIVSATYLLDPLFVDKSKHAASCTIKLWVLARKVFLLFFHSYYYVLFYYNLSLPQSFRCSELMTMTSGPVCTAH